MTMWLVQIGADFQCKGCLIKSSNHKVQNIVKCIVIRLVVAPVYCVVSLHCKEFHLILAKQV